MFGHVLFCTGAAPMALLGCLEMSFVKEKAHGYIHAVLKRKEKEDSTLSVLFLLFTSLRMALFP